MFCVMLFKLVADYVTKQNLHKSTKLVDISVNTSEWERQGRSLLSLGGDQVVNVLNVCKVQDALVRGSCKLVTFKMKFGW